MWKEEDETKMDSNADLKKEAGPLLSVALSHNIQGSDCQLPPLGEIFTDEEFEIYFKKLHEHIQQIGQGASDEEVYKSLHLPNYLTINAKASDSGILCNDYGLVILQCSVLGPYLYATTVY
jgi:hypothetical protein